MVRSRLQQGLRWAPGVVLGALAALWLRGGEGREPGRPTVAHNAGAARAVGAASVLAGAAGPVGRDVQLGQWDTGLPRATHQDLRARVTLASGAVDEHASLVAGTLVGSGQGDADARGMAPAARLWSFDSEDDATSLAGAAPFVSVSSHAYGPALGFFFDAACPEHPSWAGGDGFEDAWFGQYRQAAADMDAIAYSTGILSVWSAGNGRMALGAQSVEHYHWPDCASLQTDAHAAQDGFDTIGGAAVGKNVLTVGAASATGAADAWKAAVGSGFGPTDDGRIKPDLIAPSGPLHSTGSAADDGYGELAGTSSAAPVVAGSLALAIERFRQLHGGRDPGADTLKALAVWSARRAPLQGPSYRRGYGAFDAAAVDGVLQQDAGEGTHVVEGIAGAGDAVEWVTADVVAGAAVRVALAWLEPAATANDGGVDDGQPTLARDLDLLVVDADGRSWFAWSLDPADPNAPATAVAPNARDTVEVVDVVADSHPAGEFRVRITAPTTQRYALVSSHALTPVGRHASRPSLRTRIRFELAADEVRDAQLPFAILGDGSLTWTAASLAPWLTVVDGSGDASTAADVRVRLDARGLAAGDHRAVVTFTTDGVAGPQDVGVWLRVGCDRVCDGRSCGPDPQCGDACGECRAGERCNLAGQCVVPQAEGRCDGACVGSPDGICYCDEACVDNGDCCADACGECAGCAPDEGCEFGRCVPPCNEDNCGGPCERCAGGQCVPYADGTACDDDDLCTLGDTCRDGACVSGRERECESACARGLCQPDTGECVFEARLDCQPDAGSAPWAGRCDGGACDAGPGASIAHGSDAGRPDSGPGPTSGASGAGCTCRMSGRRPLSRALWPCLFALGWLALRRR